MTEKDIEKEINKVDRSFRLEGMPLTEENKVLLRRCLKGEITFDEAVQMMINKYKKIK
jgi:hypothetical protein